MAIKRTVGLLRVMVKNLHARRDLITRTDTLRLRALVGDMVTAGATDLSPLAAMLATAPPGWVAQELTTIGAAIERAPVPTAPPEAQEK